MNCAEFIEDYNGIKLYKSYHLDWQINGNYCHDMVAILAKRENGRHAISTLKENERIAIEGIKKWVDENWLQ